MCTFPIIIINKSNIIRNDRTKSQSEITILHKAKWHFW